MAASVKSETRFDNKFQLFIFDAGCPASTKHFCFIASSTTQVEKRFSPRQSRWIIRQNDEYMSKACRRKQSWTRRCSRAELRTKDKLCVVYYQIHQTAVNMSHYPRKITRTTSITEVLLIERLFIPINAVNYLRPIHQPKGIDLKSKRKV